MTDTQGRTRGLSSSVQAQQWAEVERVFAEALELPVSARASYLTSCSTDPTVRDAVARLLDRHDSIEGEESQFLSPLSRELASELVATADPVPAQIGRYAVQRIIGRGAFGTVYLAHDPELRRDVAIKRLSVHLGDDGPWTARFLDEARAASGLAHPHIVTIHDIGRADDDRLFIVMGYEGGGTLREQIARGPLTAQAAIQCAIEVADGLAAAHSAGLVHRDIKPENLLVTPRGVRIADFGIAKAFAHVASPVATTSHAVVVGTPAYMSPEQSMGHEVDTRSDIWSLGVVLFELLTATRPFAGATTAQTIEAIRRVKPPAPSTLRRELPGVLDEIVARCLQSDPADRFQSAESLRDALQSVDLERSSGRPDARSAPVEPVRAWRKIFAPASILFLACVGLIALGWRTLRPGATIEQQDAALAAASPVLTVLPLQAIDTLQTGRALASMITQSLRSQLTATPALRVSASQQTNAALRTGSSPATVATRLKGTALLVGTVQREDDRVWIEAALIRSDRGDTLWRTRVQRSIGEIAVAEEEIVRSVAAALGATARPWRAPDPMAYELYLRGRRALDRWNDSTVESAAFYYREAIARDSNFARAWLGLADTYITMQATPPAERFRLAKPLVARALAAEPNLADAQQAAGWIAFLYDHDWEGAEQHFLRAIELNPNDIWSYHRYAALLSATGRPDSSIAITRRAMPLDPDAASTTTHYAIQLYMRGRYDETIGLLEGLLQRDTSWRRAFIVLGRTYLAVGRNSEALPLLRKYAPEYVGLDVRGVHAHALVANGRRDEARRLVAVMEAEARARSIGAANLVVGHLALGDTARALDWLDRVPDDRGHLLFLLTEPFYDPLRGSTRWRRVIERLGLTAADTLRRAPTQ